LATLGGRLELSVAAFHLLIEHPFHAVVGGGLAYWPEYVRQWSVWQWVDAHNVYINQVLSYGLVGLVLFASMIVSLLREALRIPCAGWIHFACLGALFAMTGSYFFEPSFVSVTQKFQFLFVAALLQHRVGI